jgi:hypothetical protein
MTIRLTVVLSLIALLLPPVHAFAQSDQFPPTAHIVREGFTPIDPSWEPVSGSWSVANGTYGNSSASGTALTRLTHYRDVHPAGPGDTVMRFTDFTVRARMLNQGTTDAHLVGLVYGYQDPQNYYEVVVSATGTVTLRTVMGGVAVDEVPASHEPVPRNTWFEVEVRWNQGVASLKVNGVNVAMAVAQPEFTSGQVGFVTHAAIGRFDDLFVGVPFGDQPFLETFDEAPLVTFTPLSGQWSVVNGTYRNSAVQQTSITLAPIHTAENPGQGDTFEYTFRARMLNPYGASGNQVGVVLNFRSSDYTEIVFSPTGVAKLNRFENGAVRNVATQSYNGRRNVPFEVRIENGPGHAGIFVDGVRLFPNVAIFDVNPDQVPTGGVGLITHWAPGRFDNVQFDQGFFTPCLITFDDPLPFLRVVSGTWNKDGGTLNSTGVGQSDILDADCVPNSWGEENATQVTYSARLLNQFGASGNRVGLLYNFEDADDYFEVVFSPTGVMQLNKVFEGVHTAVTTATHTVPRNTWFDVQVIRSAGLRTTVKVNGVTLVQGLLQGELRQSRMGAITHWAKGKFDNLSMTRQDSRPPSEL